MSSLRPHTSLLRLTLGLLLTAVLGPHGADGFFIIGCDPLIQERVDPIVAPGQLSSHVHTINGGDAFAETMTYDTTQQSTCTTCDILDDLSNYWTPQLYFHHPNGSFTSVHHSGSNVYYLFRINHEGPETIKGIQPFPKGFRMIAGDPYARAARSATDQEKHETEAITYVCLGGNVPDSQTFPLVRCDGGLRVQVRFPSCWDGTSLDSDTHKSHVVYSDRGEHGQCPDTHPVRLITLFFEIFYDIKDFNDLWTPDGKSHPWVFANGDRTGYGSHGDFLMGWKEATLAAAVKQCSGDSGRIEDCPPLVPSIQQHGMRAKCRKTPKAGAEQVLGTMEKLPGCNPIQDQNPASKNPRC